MYLLPFSISTKTNGTSEIVNCWLGDLIEAKTQTRKIWDEEVGFNIKVIDKLVVADFSYFLSQGKEAIDVGTRKDTIYYNLEAYRARATLIWDFFSNREYP